MHAAQPPLRQEAIPNALAQRRVGGVVEIEWHDGDRADVERCAASRWDIGQPGRSDAQQLGAVGGIEREHLIVQRANSIGSSLPRKEIAPDMDQMSHSYADIGAALVCTNGASFRASR